MSQAGAGYLTNAPTNAQYTAQSASLKGQAFDKILGLSMSNSNILSELQGPEGSKKPFIIKDDLTKGAKDTIQFAVGTTLGQAGRRGTQQGVNYEEPPIHNSWSVQIDNLRVVMGYNEITRMTATTGASWMETYAQLCGERLGQIEQEDMLMRLRQRSSSRNTIRPSNRATLDALRYSDTVDTGTLSRGINQLSANGGMSARIGKDESGMDLMAYVCLGATFSFEGLWNDNSFTTSLNYAALRGPENPFWTGKLPMYRGTVLKKWEIRSHDNPGPIGSTIMPQAILGDSATGTTAGLNGTPSTNGIDTATTVFTLYGGGRTQASLNALSNNGIAQLYMPFEFFYGNNKLFGENISVGTSDSNTYYFVVIDPADGKWCLYSYTGAAGINGNGNSITITNRLVPSGSNGVGAGLSTLGNWTYDASVNKTQFPVGSIILQVNANVVPVADMYLFGAEVGGKAYGMVKNKRISNENDYTALKGVGVQSFYGQDVGADTQGLYFRRYIRIQHAYEYPGYSLPQL